MKKINSMILLFLLLTGIVFSMSSLSIASAQEPTDPHVRVAWNTINETTDLGHTEQNSQWIFGPQPRIWISYADNGTDIAENNFRVDVGTDLFIHITIPKSFLGVGNVLDLVRFWGFTQPRQNNVFIFEYNATDDKWSEATLHYQPGNDTPSQRRFISLNETNSEYEEDDNYKVVFACRFEEQIVKNVFWTGMQAIDTKGRPVSPSWLARLQEGGYESPPIALGTIVSPQDFSLPSYYYAEITDVDGDVIHYISDNDTFVINFYAGKPVSEILLPFAYLDWDANYLKPISWEQPAGWPASMFDPDATMDILEHPGHPPVLFFHYNETGIYALAGYPDISFEWFELEEGIGIWYPTYRIEYNDTIDVSKYYVLNDTITGYFDDNTTIRWAGYFTNNTDMDWHPYRRGGVMKPDMSLILVESVDGERLEARPEIVEKETMKLAYKSDFIEAFVFKQNGKIATQAYQIEPLNMTFLIHKPKDTVNGSLIFPGGFNISDDPYIPGHFNITTLLRNYSIQIQGSGSDTNDTHFWHVYVTYNMTLDFETSANHTWTQFTWNVYERGGRRVEEISYLFNSQTNYSLWHVHDFEISIGEEQSVLLVNFSFHEDAPSMVLNEARIAVGVKEHVEISDGTHTVHVPPNSISYPVRQVSGNTLWSPSNLRLGELDYWRLPLWTVTQDGAIDLDGNTYTKDDQYFVKRTGFWTDWGNVTLEGMLVNVLFDPSPHPDYSGDEFHSNSWMGVAKMIMEFSSNETFYWYKASDMTPVTSEEMDEIRNIMWAELPAEGEEGVPVPGYEYVTWLSVNRTIDLTQIPGLETGYWSNAWFAWGTEQHFLVSKSVTKQVWASFTAKYAGLLLFNDDPNENSPEAPDFAIIDGAVVTTEVTHVVLIDDIDSIGIRRPFGLDNLTGSVIVNTTTPISFGISIYNVNVTMYPLQIEHSDGIRGPWHFRQSYEGAIGLNSTNFDYWITTATIDEMAFDISFEVDLVEWDPENPKTWNHAVDFKVDQVIGNWTLNDFNNDVLENRGLAVNFFGVLGTVGRTEYRAGKTPVTDTNGDSTNASYYQFGAEDTPYANVTMGGLPYTWGNDTPPFSKTYISGSSTAPIGAFSLLYQSSSGQTITDWRVDASMLFMTAGYVNWGGHAIHCDPVFVSYVSAHNTGGGAPTTTTTTPTTPPSSTPTPTTTTTDGNVGAIVLVAGIVIVLVFVCVLIRRR